MKIGFKFLLTILLLTLLLGITALSGVLLSSRLLEQEMNGKFMAVSVYAMEKVHRQFARRYENLRRLANEPVLRSRDSTPARITDLLNAYKNPQLSSFAPFASISFFALDRRRIADTAGQDLGLREAASGYWQKIAAGDEYALDISPSAVPGQEVFILARLVRDNRDEPFGVVVARIPVEALQTIVERPLKLFKLGLMPNIDLLDRNGLILYSTMNKAGMLKDIWPSFDAVKDALAAGERAGTRLYTDSARNTPTEILIFAREERDTNYQGNDWILTISVPWQIAMSSMIGLRNRLVMIILGIGCLCAGIAVFLSKTITRPLVQLSKAAAEVGNGNLNIAVDVSSADEVGRLAVTFNLMVKKLDELNRALLLAASEDKLTGAMNRRKIDEVMLSEMARAKRYHTPLALILFDLDHFKKVNDTYGHLVGDEVLKSVVAMIRQNIRVNDALGRWGGEEFMLLLPEAALPQAVEVAEKIRQSMELSALDQVGRVTISCGVAAMRDDDSEDSFIKRADDALYVAKRKGRNLVEVGATA